ncbi:MAG: aminodeoxychorismate lyase, partial [Pseudomonadota bacterium]
MTDKPPKPARPSRLRGLGLAAAVLVLALGVAAIGGWRLIAERIDGTGPSTADVEIVIARGAGLATISAQLEAAGAIRSA